MTLDPIEIRKAKEHALKEFPKEAVGLIIDGKYVSQLNSSETPEKNFKCDYPLGQNLQAVIHSHTNGIPYPSAEDMRNQMAMRLPWGIIPVANNSTGEILWFGDGMHKAPLIGRVFVPGIFDCYSLVRDYYAEECKIILKEYARDDYWWETKDDLYLQNFEKEGFKVVDSLDEIKQHDAILMKIRSKVPNHAAIYLGKEMILHHLHGKLSKRDLLTRWTRNYVTHVLRHESLW